MSTAYRPIGLEPKQTTIDMLVEQTFTAVLQSYTTDYQLIIYKISDNTLLYDSTKTTISGGAYASSTLEIVVPITALLATERDLKWTLEVWNDTDSALSRETPFYNYENPIVFVNVASVINEQSNDFTSTYVHPQLITVNRFKYTLYDALEEELENSDWIYNSSLAYTFENFLDNVNYKIQIEVYDLNEVYATSGLQLFNVNYTEPSLSFTPTVTNVASLSALLYNWEGVYILEGVSSELPVTYISDFLYTDNYGVEVNTNENIYWENINIDNDFVASEIWKPNSTSFDGVFWEFSNTDGNKIKVGYDQSVEAFYREQLSEKDYAEQRPLDSDEVYLIILTSLGLSIKIFSYSTGELVGGTNTLVIGSDILTINGIELIIGL